MREGPCRYLSPRTSCVSGTSRISAPASSPHRGDTAASERSTVVYYAFKVEIFLRMFSLRSGHSKCLQNQSCPSVGGICVIGKRGMCLWRGYSKGVSSLFRAKPGRAHTSLRLPLTRAASIRSLDRASIDYKVPWGRLRRALQAARVGDVHYGETRRVWPTATYRKPSFPNCPEYA